MLSRLQRSDVKGEVALLTVPRCNEQHELRGGRCAGLVPEVSAHGHLVLLLHSPSEHTVQQWLLEREEEEIGKADPGTR